MSEGAKVESKIYSITSGNMKHDINHESYYSCIHCHFTMYDYRYNDIEISEYIHKYGMDILKKIHIGCKYPECCICERVGKM